jgi:leader peptidase (prepilin peptidase)/N-methyltransferase
MDLTPVLDLVFSCRLGARRRALFRSLARDILAARGAGRPLAPAAFAALAGLAYLLVQGAAPGWLFAPTLALLAALCLIALYDARYFVIPDGLVLLLLILGLGVLLAWRPQEIPARLLAAALAYAGLRLADFAYAQVRGRAGLGQGDAKLFSVAGLWLGFDGLPSALLYACASGLVAAMIALRTGGRPEFGAQIPFGPHLALGIWLVWTVGPLAPG